MFFFLGFAWFCIIAASDYACASSQDQWMMQLVENYQVGFGLPNFGPNYMIKKTPNMIKHVSGVWRYVGLLIENKMMG